MVMYRNVYRFAGFDQLFSDGEIVLTGIGILARVIMSKQYYSRSMMQNSSNYFSRINGACAKRSFEQSFCCYDLVSSV